mmetsp:Transcript_33323/g.43969  ORF Transcript_33323/g.43969 Transcript_33323/m.43969 type:complete len:503 (+) Transcript_33323:249-1757(+)|eukprot:CAMPEP_0117742976 /NCGR_PEP_ID=MMETSP0947-20121206/5853_1 /TAXON_ID=44440 /ORGANISM="Chattonella subsalsa, Strain CCMP2191" /LENGTH=502 /DNA_ID=CAMNT_0005559575 /DNA_START=179 /DNA_END=1687 /DNA_ORIENTATION=+
MAIFSIKYIFYIFILLVSVTKGCDVLLQIFNNGMGGVASVTVTLYDFAIDGSEIVPSSPIQTQTVSTGSSSTGSLCLSTEEDTFYIVQASATSGQPSQISWGLCDFSGNIDTTVFFSTGYDGGCSFAYESLLLVTRPGPDDGESMVYKPGNEITLQWLSFNPPSGTAFIFLHKDEEGIILSLANDIPIVDGEYKVTLSNYLPEGSDYWIGIADVADVSCLHWIEDLTIKSDFCSDELLEYYKSGECTILPNAMDTTMKSKHLVYTEEPPNEDDEWYYRAILCFEENFFTHVQGDGESDWDDSCNGDATQDVVMCMFEEYQEAMENTHNVKCLSEIESDVSGYDDDSSRALYSTWYYTTYSYYSYYYYYTYSWYTYYSYYSDSWYSWSTSSSWTSSSDEEVDVVLAAWHLIAIIVPAVIVALLICCCVYYCLKKQKGGDKSQNVQPTVHLIQQDPQPVVPQSVMPHPVMPQPVMTQPVMPQPIMYQQPFPQPVMVSNQQTVQY